MSPDPRIRHQHVKVRRLWPWRDGARLFGVGVFATLIAGRGVAHHQLQISFW